MTGAARDKEWRVSKAVPIVTICVECDSWCGITFVAVICVLGDSMRSAFVCVVALFAPCFWL